MRRDAHGVELVLAGSAWIAWERDAYKDTRHIVPLVL